MNRNLLCVILACLLLGSLPSIPWGAVNPLSSLAGKAADTLATSPAATEMTDKEIDEKRSKLESRLEELHRRLLPEAVAALHRTYRDLATPEELQEWERLTNHLAGIVESHIYMLFRLSTIRQTNRDNAAEVKRWQGFAEKPPYSISLLDSLSNAIRAKQIDLQLLVVARTTNEGESADYTKSLKISQKEVRLAREAEEKNAGKSGEPRSRWLLMLAQLRDSLNQAGIVYGETRRLVTKESLQGTRTMIDFLRLKLAAARKDYRFTEADLQKIFQAVDDRRKQLGRELDRTERDEEKAWKLFEAAEKAVRTAQAKPGAAETVGVPLDRLLKEQETQQRLFDAANYRVQLLRGMLQLLKNEKAIWQQRFKIANGQMTREDWADIRNGQNDLEILASWKEYIISKASSLQSLITSQQERLSSPSFPKSVREEVTRELVAYKAEEAVLQLGGEILNEYEQLVLRRNEEAKSERGTMTLADRARGAFDAISSLVGKIWTTELYVAEETTVVEGNKIVKPRSVTLGKVLEALLIFMVGSWLAKRLKKFFHWFAENRLKFNVSEAHLYSRLLSYVMFIVVLVSALIFVNIPLAVFAFLGGALAIGIGFGGQNLVNNFISGVILMFDKTIRMGDVVEVEGHRGRVTSIGMRSSTIKRFDGVEILVPNSLFLQQNVTNWTSSDRHVRYSVSVGVAYGSPTQETAQVIRKAVEDQWEVLKDPPAYVVFDNFADSSLNFTAYFWVELDPAINTLVVFSDIRHRIGERLAEAGIVIPFPQRDLHLDAVQPIEVKVTHAE